MAALMNRMAPIHTTALQERQCAAPRHSVRGSRSVVCHAVENTKQQQEQEQQQQPEVVARRGPLIDMTSRVSRRTLLGGLTTAGLATCPCCPRPAQADEWGYAAIDKWGGVCSAGGQQSPVNLPYSIFAKDLGSSKRLFKFGDIKFNYGAEEAVEVLNTGHGTMQVNFKPGNIASVGGVDMELLQFHFHTPSEHAMDGKRTPMEVHLVHKVQATGSLAVVGVLLEDDGKEPNPAVDIAYKFAPVQPGAKVAAGKPINPMMLLPPTDGDGFRPYMHYAGSLTTPPCSEGVDWFVMTEPTRVTGKQVVDFMRYVGGGVTLSLNSRPVQPINNRRFVYAPIGF